MGITVSEEIMKSDQSTSHVPFLILLLIPFLSLPHFVHSYCNRNPVIFNFGDSNSDTGGISAGLGYDFPLPEGRTFFQLSTGRLSDGRLVIDFLCESLNVSYLTAYLESVTPNFTNGANFAIAGSATLPRKAPFNLAIQVNQFIRFRTRSLQFSSKGVKGLVGDIKDFQNALYMIDIGQNDLSSAFSYLSPEEVAQKIPSFIFEIKDAIKRIYEHGGRKFWLHNTGPLGCLPQKLVVSKVNASDFDQYGCIVSLNEGAKFFNRKLSDLCEELRSEMQNVTVVYVDIFAAKYELFVNSATHGFDKPLMVCCGNGGPPYNFNPNVTCLKPGYSVCDQGSRYISWDGVHYTDAANSIVASKILSTKYSTPQIMFDHFCST